MLVLEQLNQKKRDPRETIGVNNFGYAKLVSDSIEKKKN